MYGVLFYLIAIAVLRAIERKRERSQKARGLCSGCSFAHIQYAVNAQTATFCTFGGGVRPVTLDVLYCTDYRDRNAPPRMIRVGFVREVASAADAELATPAT
jgi:hypothetical protein